MRILHTSDWHLGVSLEQAPRHEEHARFLAWLLETIQAESIDCLVIAGDVYHYMQPSAAAQAQFFEFLARARQTCLTSIVMVAGNHDSPSRFDAPGRVLEALDMHVVGGLPDELERCLAPVVRNGEVIGVVVAVPYVSESRLGISAAERSPAEVRVDYEQAFRELYAELADLAQARFPGVPLVATGHMTVMAKGGRSEEGDFFTPIHQFLTISGLPPDVFDARFSYVALGHIHRHHRIGSSNAWYSGTPVPTNVVEARTPRYVVVVEAGEDGARARRVKVPRWRDIFEIVGEEEEVHELLESLTWVSELPPYLYVELVVEAPGALGVDAFRRALVRRFDEEERPRIVSFKKSLKVSEVDDEPEEVEELEDLTPEEVFDRMYRQRFETDAPEHILAAFRTLFIEEEA